MVRGEGFRFNHNLVSVLGGTEEGCHHGVEVGGQCVHGSNFNRLCSYSEEEEGAAR